MNFPKNPLLVALERWVMVLELLFGVLLTEGYTLSRISY